MPTDNRQKLLIVVAIAAVALFAGDKLLLTPLMDAWSARAQRITTLRNDVARRLLAPVLTLERRIFGPRELA